MENKALPIAGNVQGFIDSLDDSLWKFVPFNSWPYWGYVPYILGITIGLLIIMWFYKNFWRRSSGELPSGHKFT